MSNTTKNDVGAMDPKSVDEGGFLTRDAIIAVDDNRYEEVEVPEWGAPGQDPPPKVRVRTLTGTDLDAFQSSMLVGEGKKQKISTLNIRAKLVALSLVDAAGKPLFTMRDIEALGRKSAAALQRVFDVAQRLSKISDEDVEDLAKNSSSVPGDAISSDSL